MYEIISISTTGVVKVVATTPHLTRAESLARLVKGWIRKVGK